MTLYAYQEVGRDFLAERRRAYLGDAMGFGKSPQAITAASIVAPPRILIVCPASAVPNWHAEWEKWGGPGDPEIRSYSSMLRRKGRAPDLLIADEAHYCKSPGAKRTRAVLGLARKAEYAWLLSGTPMPNNPTELYAPLKYLWPEILEELGIKTAADWLYTFCKVRHTKFGGKPYGVKNGALLRSIVQRIMLRRTTREGMPELRVDLVRLPRDRMDLTEYAALDASEHTYNATLRRALGMTKAPAVARQIIEELHDHAYRKIVVLYYHRDVGTTLREAFTKAGHTPIGFDGSTPQNLRWNAITQFQQDPSQRVFLAQQSAAGIAINLTAANEIVLVEPAWTPDDNKQAIRRVCRIGQEHPCRARIFAIDGTIDNDVMSAIRAKVKMQREIF